MKNRAEFNLISDRSNFSDVNTCISIFLNHQTNTNIFIHTTQFQFTLKCTLVLKDRNYTVHVNLQYLLNSRSP